MPATTGRVSLGSRASVGGGKVKLGASNFKAAAAAPPSSGTLGSLPEGTEPDADFGELGAGAAGEEPVTPDKDPRDALGNPTPDKSLKPPPRPMLDAAALDRKPALLPPSAPVPSASSGALAGAAAAPPAAWEEDATRRAAEVPGMLDEARLAGQQAQMEVQQLQQALQQALRRADEVKSQSERQQAEIQRLQEANAGLARQRTELLEQQRAASEGLVSALGQGAGGPLTGTGVFPPGEELAHQQAKRREAFERTAKVEVELHQTKALLSDRQCELQRESRLRTDAEKSVQDLQRQVKSMTNVIEAVDVRLDRVTQPDGTIDPLRLVLELASMALPHIDNGGDPVVAVAQLETAVRHNERPPLLPGTHVAAPRGGLAPMSQGTSLVRPCDTPPPVHGRASGPVMLGGLCFPLLGPPPQPVLGSPGHMPPTHSWPAPLGAHAPGVGPLLGWQPAPPLQPMMMRPPSLQPVAS